MEMDRCEYTQDEMGKKYPKMMHHTMDKSLNQLRMSIPTLENMSNDQILSLIHI